MLLASAILFLVPFAVHVVWWRIRWPQATASIVIRLFVFGVPICAAILIAAESLDPAWRSLLPEGASHWAESILLALAVAAAYVMSYPPVEVDSPTLVIIRVIAAAGKAGLDKNELYRLLDDEALVVPRILDLLREGLASEAGGRYALTRKGSGLAGFFAGWRKFLRAGKGG